MSSHDDRVDWVLGVLDDSEDLIEEGAYVALAERIVNRIEELS